jgi:Tol biopolymer transport system component
MSAPRPHRPQPRLRRTLLPWIAAATVPLLFGCNGAGDAFAPADGSSDQPASSPVTVPSEPVSGEASLISGQRILFMSYRNGSDPDLYKMDTQGTQVVRLIGPNQNESRAAWSYDNKRIALVRNRTNGGATLPDIYVINADGTNGHWLRTSPFPYAIQDPSWSPDGARLLVRIWIQSIAYIGWIDVASQQVNLFNANVGGIVGREPSYDATGKKIIYVGATNKTIEQIDASGANHKVRYTTTTAVNSPAFSPDGTKIAFTRAVGTNYNLEIYVKNLTNGTVQRLTTSAGPDNYPTWSPDGSRIAFGSARSGTDQIWSMSATGGSLARLTHTSTAEEAPSWSH